MKDLKNLKGAKVLSKNEQKVIKGGYEKCGLHPDLGTLCHVGFCCVGSACLPCMEP